jgi:ribosomal protein S18 acetylase RimI-like enzyme
MNNLVIKEFTLSEYEMAYELWHSTKGVCNCDKCMHYDSKEEIERYLKKNPGMSFAAIENGELVGIVLAGHDGRTGLIYRLTVSEKFRKRGIAKRLVEKSLVALKKDGIIAVKAFVLSDNPAGNAFWEKIGFKELDIASTRAKEI